VSLRPANDRGFEVDGLRWAAVPLRSLRMMLEGAARTECSPLIGGVVADRGVILGAPWSGNSEFSQSQTEFPPP
jgi:hypothetical protein